MGTQAYKVTDFGYMYWADGWRSRQKEMHLYTCTYGAAFDVCGSGLTHLGAFRQPRNALSALHARGADILSLPSYSLSWQVLLDNKVYSSHCYCNTVSDVAFTQNGRYFNKAELNNCRLYNAEGENLPLPARVVVSSMPDYLTISLELFPKKEISTCVLTAELKINEEIIHLEQQAKVLLVEYKDGTGLVIASPDGEDLDIKNGLITARQPCVSAAAGVPIRVGIKLMPKKNMLQTAASDRFFTAPPLAYCIEAKGITPYKDYLECTYDKQDSLYYIKLPGKLPEQQAERISLRIENPFHEKIKLPVLLSKAVQVMGAPVLTDGRGIPLGIEVQTSCERVLSGREVNYMDCFFLLELAPGETADIEMRIFYSLLGETLVSKLYHLYLRKRYLRMQLQEYSIGADGACFSFDMDNSELKSVINDIYPLLLEQNGEPINRSSDALLWGCDLLSVYNQQGERCFLSGCRSLVENGGPAVCRAGYGGITSDGCIEAHIIQTVPSADDCLRYILSVRYDVIKQARYSRTVLFSLGAEQNNRSLSALLAYGNLSGLIKEFVPERGGKRYLTDRITAGNDKPWFYLQSHEAEQAMNVNRGLILRSYKAVFGGRRLDTPYFALYGTEDRFPGTSAELVLPPEVYELMPGDYIEFTAEVAVYPNSLQAYYGPNENFLNAIKRFGCSWKLLYREVLGNNLQITVYQGELLSGCPVIVLAHDDQAEFEIKGGLGYSVIYISGVKKPYEKKLQLLKNGTVTDISISEQLPFALAYDMDSDSYTLGYLCNMDDSTDGRGQRYYQFI